MPSKPVRCAGGCGRTQAMTVEEKAADKAPFTIQQKWLCPDCQDKKRKREEADKARAAAAAPPAAPAPQADAAKAAAPGAGPA